LIEILNSHIISEDDVTGQYHAFGPSPSPQYIVETPPGCTTCSTSCKYEAGSDPHEMENRPEGCSMCSTTCMGDCSGSCVGGCGDANCEGQCSLTCQSACSVECDITCRGDCSGGCTDDCVNGCKETCTSGCSGACEGCTGCAGGCIDACVNGCKYSCMNVATTDGTHIVLPKWPTANLPIETQKAYYNAIRKPVDQRTSEEVELINNVNAILQEQFAEMGITDERFIELLGVIKVYLDELVKYDYRRISELDEARVIHDNDQFVGHITIDGIDNNVGTVDLSNLNMVISDFDNRTVRITAASLTEFIRTNYKNYWVWTPVVEEDETGNKTKISWEFHNSFDETTPESINLADLVTGGVGRATESDDGLMPHEMFALLHNKNLVTFESLTGNHPDGTPAPQDTDLIRLEAGFNGNADSTNVLNSALLDDLTVKFAPAGVYLEEATLNAYKLEVAAALAAINDNISDNYTDNDTLAATYLTQTDAASTYATILNVGEINTRVTNNSDNITNILSRLDAEFYTKGQADLKFITAENATSRIPTRSANSNGLMTSADLTNIDNAITAANTATTRVGNLTSRVENVESALDNALVRTSYASTDYNTGIVTAGTVTVPTDSNVEIGANGALDIKDFGVVNLIRNSNFLGGFNSEWNGYNNIDAAASTIIVDQFLNQTIAKIAIVGNGVISQNFVSNSLEGFTVAILFKKASVAKTIEVKIDNNEYVSHTIPANTGVNDEYYIVTFYFDSDESELYAYHTLYIHNPDTTNTVSYDMTNIMVQQGKKFTGWDSSPYDGMMNESVKIISYDNNITFKDLLQRYTEDVYDEDGVTILHRAGEIIEPSSSIIMHKDKQYMYMHITAAQQIDGPIRSDVIPLRINLLTGNCDISGNAVTAGTLRDTSDPSITLNVPVAQMNAFFSGASTAFIRYLQEYETGEFPKVVVDLRRIISSMSEISLGAFKTVGTFDSNTNKNGEIFNDYKNNSATGEYSHASGQNTIATANASTVIGKYNVADGTGANDPKHLFIVGNGTADNDRSNIVEVSDDTLNVNGNITKNNNPIPEFVELTQAQYDALVSPDPDITYLITDYDASGGGSGGGGEPFGRTLLYDSGSYIDGAPYQTDVALSDNLSNYDSVICVVGNPQDNGTANGYQCDTFIADVTDALDSDTNGVHYAGYEGRWCVVKFTDTTFNETLRGTNYEGSAFNPQIYKIYGYKYGSGGGSSGGSSFTRATLYDSGSYLQHIPYQQDVTLLDNLSNYDTVEFIICSPNDNAREGTYQAASCIYDVPHLLDNPLINWAGWSQRTLTAFIYDTKVRQSYAYSNEGSGNEPYIYKIIGYKYGSGGGGTPTGLGDLAYKDSASGTAVTNVEYDENTHRITITLGTVTVS